MTAATELLQRISMGDQSAFSVFMRMHGPAIYTRLFRLLRQKELAEETMQDVFIEIWETREALIDIRNIDAFLNVLARNKGVNALDKWIREKKRNRAWGELYSSEEDNDPEERQRWQLVDQAILNLPPQQQKVWIMSRRQKMTYEAIAAELNISRDAVKQHLQAATRNLTTYLSNYSDTAVLLFWSWLVKNIF